jgi:hypothetical protein
MVGHVASCHRIWFQFGRGRGTPKGKSLLLFPAPSIPGRRQGLLISRVLVDARLSNPPVDSVHRALTAQVDHEANAGFRRAPLQHMASELRSPNAI